MKGLLINKPMRAQRGGYFNMIGDTLIIPSKRATQLDEFYFKARTEKIVGKDSTKVAAKKLLEDKSSGVFFESLWKDSLAIDNLTSRVATAVSLANEALQRAKNDRQGAIDALGKRADVTQKTARERVDQAIVRGGIDDTLREETTKKLVLSSIANIEKYVYFWTVADAYTNEIERRLTNDALVKRAINKGDVKELKSLRSNVVVTELKDQIDEAIKSIEQGQKDAEEKQKAIDEANKKLSGATTPEQKASAQAELDALLRAGSDGAGAIAKGTGLPKGAIYIGIGLVVAIGAYFMFRKKA
jgi:flagellar hook-basal body complex protein FliE